MSDRPSGSDSSFGELLRQLRKRVRLTQRELGIAVGYSEAQITRLESNDRQPDVEIVATRFIDALDIKSEYGLARRLVELAVRARGEKPDEKLVSPEIRDVLRRRQTNLPIALTRLVGRERDLPEISHLLKSNHLVNLIGIGGVGKTRLAQEVGWRVLDSYAEGVWLAELAPITDAAFMTKSIVDIFNLPDQPNRSEGELLLSYLRDRNILLILDSCEHLIDACAVLAERLLQACPDLRILATSREPLRVTGELLYEVSNLGTPVVNPLQSVDQILNSESVQMFVDQASAALAGFTPTPENIPALAQICARLDGIPLAIEMAAARLPTMTLDDIVAGLDDRFSLLSKGRRTALPRHQTLHATLEWSYRLLSEQERRVFARLAVFVDGCYADAARAVCADEGQSAGFINPGDVVSLVLGLVEKSLVVADRRHEQTRYRMLETVRQYAAEKLDEMGEVQASHYRLANFLLTLSTPVGEYPIGRDRLAWYERQDAELSNVRAMLTWLRLLNDTGETMMRLAMAWWPVWLDRGYHFSEGATWLEEALAHDHGAPARVRVGVLRALAIAYFNLNWGSRRSTEVANELYSLSVQVGHYIYAAMALGLLGRAALETAYGERAGYQAAIDIYERGLALLDEPAAKVEADEGSRMNTEVVLIGMVSDAYLMQDQKAKAGPLIEEGISIAIQADILHSLRRLLVLLSSMDPARAIARCEEALAHQRILNSPDGLAAILDCYGALLINVGDFANAKAPLNESLGLWRELSVNWSVHGGLVTTLSSLSYLNLLEGHYAEALLQMNERMQLLRDMGFQDAYAWAQYQLGLIYLESGDINAADRQFWQYLDYLASNRHRLLPIEEVVYMTIARMWFIQGALERAATLYGYANKMRGRAQEWFGEYAWTYQRDRDALTVLGSPEYAAARSIGEAMTPANALDFVLQAK